MFPKVLLNIPQIICYSPNGATLNKLKTVYTFKEKVFSSPPNMQVKVNCKTF